MTLDANNRNHGEKGTTDAGKYQTERAREPQITSRPAGTSTRWRAPLAAIAALNEKTRDLEAAAFINDVTVRAKESFPGADRLAFILNPVTKELVGVDVYDASGAWRGPVKVKDVYDGAAEPGYVPSFTSSNLHGCFEEDQRSDAPESTWPSFSVSVSDAEKVDPADTGSLTPHLEKAAETFRENDAARFVDEIQAMDAPNGATQLMLVASDDELYAAKWLNEDRDTVAECDPELLERVKALDAMSLPAVMLANKGFRNEWNDLYEEDEFYIQLGPVEEYPRLGHTQS